MALIVGVLEIVEGVRVIVAAGNLTDRDPSGSFDSALPAAVAAAPAAVVSGRDSSRRVCGFFLARVIDSA
jgi:hypothetical protein